MTAGAIIGGGIALLQPKLLWIFFIYGALASAGFIPTIIALYSKKVRARTLEIAITLSLIISLPLSVYANLSENTNLIVMSSLSAVIISACTFGISALLSHLRHKKI